jgi:hypothetical protein
MSAQFVLEGCTALLDALVACVEVVGGGDVVVGNFEDSVELAIEPVS